MLQNEIVDILLRAGIPANTKGFTYIHDALELMDKDSYYFSGKVCVLYAKIAKQNGATPGQVERAIRYAFEGALTRGDLESVEQYLDPINTRNSNELKVLFLRWRQETHPMGDSSCDAMSVCRAQIYNEILDEMNALTFKIQQAVSNNGAENIAMQGQ
ncbi:Stage 0 sporulation protein A [uncultured Clostridium sp.]|uniref:Sporulation initiation factor Spo0A C-terminal domain-containing protein n=1 Tax=Flintibacter hominis TaxID=2763048 RepID=A0A8J6JBV3_9FIRM|nr:sporulation initiation factor Spo0A C-terminal domain-containing protein [Flintibacter hominis]MBC5723273.1 sporulation initiation factor Spo0A C-terminal domain-containing protein [Flintibacter hominis]SCH69761.1 Stage 0 sporulation protein A [uncultured Clostridium sp.]